MPLRAASMPADERSPADPSQSQGSPGSETQIHLHNIHFRQLTSDDWHKLQLFHDRLSEQTVALRFHGGKKHLSQGLAQRLTHVDGHDNVAWVATTGSRGRIIGVARYARLRPSSAEVAFVIEDEYQHLGVGRRLMERLRQTALENGITEFVADVLPGNLPMMHLLAEAGAVETLLDSGVCSVRVALESSR
ncbi:MAG TPA: GNAT family N-acetyltransferase [Chloroflexota bacterium]